MSGDYSSYADIGEVANSCFERIRDELRNLTRLNIIVCGKTGVGKSTLINSLFREDLAEVGHGRSVTLEMTCYTKEGFPLAIYDTRGFEMDEDVQEKIKAGILGEIRKGNAQTDLGKRIHCIWYCVNALGNRFEDAESRWLKELRAMPELENIPIIVIITQASSKGRAQKLREYIRVCNPEVTQVICCLAQDEDDGEREPVRAYGLDTIVKVMANELPAPLKKAFANVQKVDLDYKVSIARKVMYGFVSTAAMEAAAPIPLADAAMLVPTQVTMIASITSVFGIELERATLITIISGTIGAGGATILGKTIVSNIFKFLPGVGTAAGIAIGSVTAGTLTLALGETFIQIMSMIFKGEYKAEDLRGDAGRKMVSDVFKQKSREASASVKDIIHPK